MKTTSIGALFLSLLVAAGSAHAGIPLTNATCPGSIEVHADQGGPIYINGREAQLQIFNENYYEARGGGVTISLSVNPDGSPSVSYTGRGGSNGVCTVLADNVPGAGPGVSYDLIPKGKGGVEVKFTGGCWISYDRNGKRGGHAGHCSEWQYGQADNAAWSYLR